MREALRIARREKGLTQEDLARIAEIERSVYSRIETGERTPTVDIALRIARALDCSIEDLFDEPVVLKQRNYTPFDFPPLPDGPFPYTPPQSQPPSSHFRPPPPQKTRPPFFDPNERF